MTRVKFVLSLYDVHDPFLRLGKQFHVTFCELKEMVRHATLFGWNGTYDFEWYKRFRTGPCLCTRLVPHSFFPLYLHLGRWERVFTTQINSAKRESDASHTVTLRHP